MATSVRQVLLNEPIGDGQLPALDGRTHALKRLRLYLSLLRFARVGDIGGAPHEFRIPIKDIHEEQPDDPSKLAFPSLSFLAGQGEDEAFGLGPPKYLEETVDTYGRGTVLVHLCDYTETFGLEIWAGDAKAERRSMFAGLRVALRSVDSQAIAFRLPDYFDRIARFWTAENSYTDDPSVVAGRRRGVFRVTLQVPEVRLVRYETMHPRLIVEVVEAGEADPAFDAEASE